MVGCSCWYNSDTNEGGANGFTLYERLEGKSSNTPTAPVGESVLCKLGQDASSEKVPKSHPRFMEGNLGIRTRIGEHTMRPKINSNDFGGFGNELADSNSNFAAEIVFWRIRIFGVFKVQSHTMWPSMCMCCGLFAPTQFHFECCGVFDDAR